MKKIIITTVSLLVLSLPLLAQIPRPPRIVQPGATPRPTPAVSDDRDSKAVSPGNASQTDGTARKPEATETPVLMINTLDVRADLDSRYWKVPNESNYTSWIPQVRFKVFYKGKMRLRYAAEYFMPDGKTWFSETLEQNMVDQDAQTVEIISSRQSDRFANRSTDKAGIYGVKITDTRDNSVVFQGKFKVNKFKYGPETAMFKNQYSFYVDQDWNLPIGYVWLNWSGSNSHAPLPTVSVWLKGDLRPGDLEARLVYGGQDIATTDEMGQIRDSESRIPNVHEKKDETFYRLWNFSWSKIRYAIDQRSRNFARQAKFINEMDGEHTVKIFLKGKQIREARFSVSGGNLLDNGIAKQNSLGDSKIIIPVRIIGTDEKWDANAWKTMAFYGNPLRGFSVP